MFDETNEWFIFNSCIKKIFEKKYYEFKKGNQELLENGKKEYPDRIFEFEYNWYAPKDIAKKLKKNLINK